MLPPSCAGCGKPGVRLCQVCLDAVEPVPAGKCVLCGQQHGGGAAFCSRTNALDSAVAWGYHTGPLRKVIHRLKYQRDLALGEALCQNLEAVVMQAGMQVDIAAPVPLAAGRERDRGYNQAAILALPLAAGLGVRYAPRIIRRVRETESQVGLSLRERQENVADAFRARPDLIGGKRVLLVDDVLTTGSTLDAAAQALKEAGAVYVGAVVASRAVRQAVK